jgi:hypothetical protein
MSIRKALAVAAVGTLVSLIPLPAQAQDPGHSGMVLCLRPLVPEKLIDLPGFNFPGGAVPAETQVIGFAMSDGAECPS